jgi:hypothetical protein
MREPVFMHCPATLQLVAAVVGGREDAPAPLATSAMSWARRSTGTGSRHRMRPCRPRRRAALLIAHGCAILERHGGLAPRLRGVVAAVVEQVS